MSEANEDRSILVVANDSTVRGYDRATGHQVWEHLVRNRVLGLTVQLAGSVELAIHGGRVLAAMRDRLLCLDYRTGTLIGEVPLPSTSQRPTFVLDDDRLYIAAGDRLECLTLDGQRLWSAPRPHDRGGAALGFPGNIRQGDGIGNK